MKCIRWEKEPHDIPSLDVMFFELFFGNIDVHIHIIQHESDLDNRTEKRHHFGLNFYNVRTTREFFGFPRCQQTDFLRPNRKLDLFAVCPVQPRHFEGFVTKKNSPIL